jgi:hypothetical protein
VLVAAPHPALLEAHPPANKIPSVSTSAAAWPATGKLAANIRAAKAFLARFFLLFSIFPPKRLLGFSTYQKIC